MEAAEFVSDEKLKANTIGDMHDDVVIDMMSRLPDDVLTHVLSFLSTKEAVHTCILSKRWSHVWASVPIVKLDRGEFLTYNLDVVDFETKERKCDDKFERFVNGLLENRGSSRVDMFVYSWSSEYRDYNTSLKWLDRVTALMPRVINVSILCNNELNLPDSVFSCASLQKLVLDIYNFDGTTIIRPELINLPSLKVVELHYVALVDGFTQKLFLGCPALESLILGGCDLSVSDIKSAVLKELNIHDCYLHCQVRICCPGLVSLSINSCPVFSHVGLVSLESMASLKIAVIELYERSNYGFKGHSRILNVLSGLSNATSIKLCFVCPQLKDQLMREIPRCRTFNNLKNLEIGEWDVTNEFDLVACFLEHSPNLQELTLHLNEQSQCKTEEVPSIEGLRDILFQREYLEVVRIFRGNEAKLVEKLIEILKGHVKIIGTIVIL